MLILDFLFLTEFVFSFVLLDFSFIYFRLLFLLNFIFITRIFEIKPSFVNSAGFCGSTEKAAGDLHMGPSSLTWSKAHDDVVPSVAQNWKREGEAGHFRSTPKTLTLTRDQISTSDFRMDSDDAKADCR